jgi:hypothetical protein
MAKELLPQPAGEFDRLPEFTLAKLEESCVYKVSSSPAYYAVV